MLDLSIWTLLMLALLGLVGGIGITAIGPGGVLPTVGLFALTSLTPPEVAGTAIVTHIATGLLGTAVYARSGHLRNDKTRRMAAILAATAIIATPIGVLANAAVSQRAFGVVLGGLLAVVGALVLLRERRARLAGPGSALAGSGTRAEPAQLSLPATAAIGLGVALVCGVVGVGGPMLTVPILVALRVPVLESLAAAQVQSVLIAGAGTAGYLAAGAIDWPLAALIGVPELVGVILGWKLARALPTRLLKYLLVVALFALAPYVALHG